MQYFPEIEQNEIKEELLELNELEQRVIALGVDCEHLLKQGIAKDIILDYAKEKEACTKIDKKNAVHKCERRSSVR